MAFVTQINYNRQLTQSSGVTASASVATFSGATHHQQDLWVGLTPYSFNATQASGHNDYSYTGNSGYTFIVQQANQQQFVSDKINTNIYDDGRVASYGASITAYSGLTSGHTVLAIAQAPLPPPDINSAVISLTASSLQIATSSLISAGAAHDLGLDASGNVVRDSSSLRYKKEIEDLKFSNLDKLLKLRPRKFKWRSNGAEDWGYIAEEVDALGLKEFVNYEYTQHKAERVESVKYKKLTILLIEYLKQYGSVKSPTNLKCECPKDEFIVLEEDCDFILDSSKTHKYVIKSFATCKIFPDNGLIDKEWESLEILPESCVEFRYYKPLSCWVIVSSDGIKES